MNLAEASRRRNLSGRAAALFCIIFLVAAVDGLVSRFREPVNLFRMLPGESVKINGPLREEIKDLSLLSYSSDTDGIQLDFEAVHSGFWLGGYMWRGLLSIAPRIEPGNYKLTVGVAGAPPQDPVTVFQIRVYRDRASLTSDSRSLLLRYLNVSPWWVFGLFLPLTGVAFAVVFYLSQRRDQLLARHGKAEIYKVAKGITGYDVAFGLGTKHGVRPGTRLTIFNEQGERVGSLEAQEVSETDSTAVLSLDCVIKPGYIVSLER